MVLFFIAESTMYNQTAFSKVYFFSVRQKKFLPRQYLTKRLVVRKSGFHEVEHLFSRTSAINVSTGRRLFRIKNSTGPGSRKIYRDLITTT